MRKVSCAGRKEVSARAGGTCAERILGFPVDVLTEDEARAAGVDREAFLDPTDETNYLAAQAVVINLAETLERLLAEGVVVPAAFLR